MFWGQLFLTCSALGQTLELALKAGQYMSTWKGENLTFPSYFVCGLAANSIPHYQHYSCVTGTQCCGRFLWWCTRRCNSWGTCQRLIKKTTNSMQIMFCHSSSWSKQVKIVALDYGPVQAMQMCPANYYAVGFTASLSDLASLNGLKMTCRKMNTTLTTEVLIVDGGSPYNSQAFANKSYFASSLTFKYDAKSNTITGLKAESCPVTKITEIIITLVPIKDNLLTPTKVGTYFFQNKGKQVLTKVTSVQKNLTTTLLIQNSNTYMTEQSFTVGTSVKLNALATSSSVSFSFSTFFSNKQTSIFGSQISQSTIINEQSTANISPCAQSNVTEFLQMSEMAFNTSSLVVYAPVNGVEFNETVTGTMKAKMGIYSFTIVNQTLLSPALCN